MMGGRSWVVVFACVSAPLAMAAGCDSSYSSGVVDADASTGDAADTDAPHHDAGGDGGVVVDAGADGCVTFAVPSNADTYLIDDGAHCNASQTYGIATALHARMNTAEYALARFELSAAVQAALPSGTATLAVAGTTCDGGVCAGNAFAMRSDWQEGANDPQGADLCRRAFPSSSWGDGGDLSAPIASPADYDVAPMVKMTLASGRWTSDAFGADKLGQRIAFVDGGAQTTLLFALSGSGELTFPSRESDGGGLVLTITRCQ